MKSVRDDDLKNKKVFLRTDFNVTMKEGAIVDDYRIQKAIPTIQFLLDLEAIVIIGTHLGRPKGQFNPEFSTVPVAKRLGELLGHPVDAIDQVTGSEVAAKVAELKSGQILMLGNLRFDPREETNADDFAQELASLAEVYVNDGFGVSHRGDASIDAITKFLPGYAGLLLESEITSLNLLLENPISPL